MFTRAQFTANKQTPSTKDPANPFDDKAVGLATLSSVLFCTTTGLGVGAFVAAPAIGGLAGGAVGIASGIWLIPSLMRDWR